jgi:ribulose kinase
LPGPLPSRARPAPPNPQAKWPQEVLPLGARVGGLTADAAAHLGLAPGTLVAQGGADAFIGLIGIGVVEPGQLGILTGGAWLALCLAWASLRWLGSTWGWVGGGVGGQDGAWWRRGGLGATGQPGGWAVLGHLPPALEQEQGSTTHLVHLCAHAPLLPPQPGALPLQARPTCSWAWWTGRCTRAACLAPTGTRCCRACT